MTNDECRLSDRSDKSDASDRSDTLAPPSPRLVRLAVLVACASVLQVAESLLPHPLPGVRIGLANIITIVAIAELGFKSALELAVLRTLVSSLVLGTFLAPAFVLSFAGGLASAVVMVAAYALARRLPGLGFIGISVAGAVSHILAQIGLVYLLFVHSAGVLWLAPWLVLSAVATGILTGLVAVQALRNLERGDEGLGAGDEGRGTMDWGRGTRDQESVAVGPLARVRPEFKVAAVVAIALPVVIFGWPSLYAGVFLLLVLFGVIGRVRPAALLGGLRRAWSLILLAFLVPALTSGWGRIVVQLGPLRITETGLGEGGLFAARLLILLFATRLLALTSTPADVAAGLARLLSPLRRFGFDPDAIGQALGLSWAFFPVLWRGALESVRSNRARRGWFGRVISLPGDIVADLYRQAEALAAAQNR